MLLLFYRNAAAGSYSLTVTPAVVSIAGQPVNLRVSRQLTAAPETVAIAGQSVGLVASRRLSVSPGVVAVTGQSVGLTADRKLTVTPATVQIVGQSVNLTYTPASGSYALTVIPATVAIAGQAVSLNYSGQRAGGIRRKRAPVVDVIWPDDPRHPNYIAPLAPLAGPTPERIAPNVIRVPQVAARQAAEPVQITQERPRYDAEIAILLLAA